MNAPITAMEFARVARLLSDETRRLGLCTPGFRSPPRLEGCNRTLRRRLAGPPMISVRLSGRTINDVIDDMVQGVLVVNDIKGPNHLEIQNLLAAAAEPGRRTNMDAEDVTPKERAA